MDQSGEDIVSKDSLELREFLEENGVPVEVAKKFDEEDIDGAAFLDLTEADIKSMVPKLGLVKKVMRLQKNVTEGARVIDQPFSTPTTPSQREVHVSSVSPATSPVTPSSFTPFSPLGSTPDDSGSDTASISSASQLSQRKFAIPESWPPAIMQCISQHTEEEQRKHLSSSLRNEIVRVLSVQMFCYTTKPGKAFCTQVSQMLVKKYPFMKDSGERVSGYGSWEKKLIEKVMHNAYWKKPKRNLDEDDGCSGDLTPKPKRGRPSQSQVLTRYPPLRDIGDDETTNSRNRQQIERELEKERPKRETILLLSRHTFSYRRSEIVDESNDVTASSILSKYKELEKPYVIIQEMDLILEKQDVFKSAMNDWKVLWVPAILQFAYQCTGKAATLVLQAKSAYEDDLAVDEKTAIATLCITLPKKGVKDALLYISEDFKATDNPDDICSSTQEHSAPRLACFPGDDNWQYFLLVENQIVCCTSDFSQAVCLWFSLHYVLNLEYCPKVKEVALFFQEFVFKLPATSGMKRQKTATYLTITTGIKNFTA